MARILVTGATGYIGGRLIPLLLERGDAVRVLVRDADRVQGRLWAEQVEIVEGDLLQSNTLPDAVRDVEAAYYLVHSMGAGEDFAERDRQAAHHFCDAVQRHAPNLRHVIYLGGLLPEDESRRSGHLISRAETGQILRDRLPTTEFRAGPIIGSGSASFEMVRYLTERLPVMVTPRWVKNEVEPIAIRDVLAYMTAALDREAMGVVEIGGGPLTFKQMMQVYAKVRGLPRVILPTPVLAPKLAALWVGLVTPISNRLAVPLVQGVVASLVVRDHRARTLFADIRPMGYEKAVRLALHRLETHDIETRWSGALGEQKKYHLEDSRGMIKEVRSVTVNASQSQVYATISSLGGDVGWLVWGWAWKLRGLLDQFVGGPGLRRGRRDPTQLLPGEAVDFWRVEAAERPRLLRLRAEMKVPGRAWLQFEVEQQSPTQAKLVQTAIFAPKGFFGAAYWYVLYPLHRRIFTDMVHAIAKRAETS